MARAASSISCLLLCHSHLPKHTRTCMHALTHPQHGKGGVHHLLSALLIAVKLDKAACARAHTEGRTHECVHMPQMKPQRAPQGWHAHPDKKDSDGMHGDGTPKQAGHSDGFCMPQRAGHTCHHAIPCHPMPSHAILRRFLMVKDDPDSAPGRGETP